MSDYFDPDKPIRATSAIDHRPIRSTTDRRKQSLYLPLETLDEIREEAARQDRSISWIVQRSWELARTDIRGWPTHRDKRYSDD